MADGNSTEIFDGVVDVTALSWKVSITDPMPLTLKFSGLIKETTLVAQSFWESSAIPRSRARG
jgi:hypothetical protein